MELSPLSVILIALLLAAWTIAAAVLVIRAEAKTRRTQALQKSFNRMQTLMDVAPAIPILVRVDGRIEAPERLARWLGLDHMPRYLSELAGQNDDGLRPDQVESLWEKVRVTQASAAPFTLNLTPPGSKRSLALHGALADPQVSPGGASIVWVFDFTTSEEELARLQESADRAQSDFAALIGLIEAAPMPMWFRDTDLKLQLVNRAYVEAVGAASLEAVVTDQIELLEPRDGQTPAQMAGKALAAQTEAQRSDAVTIDGQRRSVRVSDLPLGPDGVAGYAFDIEEQQQVAREFRAFREAQRAVLDQLSVGVAQFNADEQLSFANRPFRRLFGLTNEMVEGGIAFEQFLADARDHGSTPEVRDFPEWRREHRAWFDAADMQEENWPLTGGMHLRIVGQPLPDGGLVFIAEDRTEQLALSATRDTLLRTRAATLDSLFEALAIFAPDGSVQLWNRSFAGTWGLDADLLDRHPGAEELLEAIGANLARPQDAEKIGAVVRAATLDRREEKGQTELADGRSLRFAGVPLPDGNGLLTVLDITDSQKAEQALRERAAALEEADAIKASFLANMSYEFRTPLTSISGFAELLQCGAAGALEPNAVEYVEAILTSVERLTEQVENVLDLSQSQAGLMRPEKEEIDLLAFLTTMVREREQVIIDAGLGLDLKGKRGRVVDADPRQLGRALGHLLDNAIAGTPKEGMIHIELPKPRRDDDWRGRAIIADTGKGMTPDELARVQGQLTTNAGSDETGDDTGVDTTGADKTGPDVAGSGLGIRLARQLIEAHGGKLELSSEKGVGTKAVVTLP